MTQEFIYFFGFSGHALSVMDGLPDSMELAGYFDQKETSISILKKVPFHGNEREVNVPQIVGASSVFPTVGNNELRKSLVVLFEELGLTQTRIIHPKAYVSANANIGLSSFISAGAIVNHSANIGKGVIVNSGAIVEHECQVGDFTHIAPGATLLGNVHIGSNCFIGANATIKEGMTIGDNTVVGAGSVVLSHIGDNEKWVGVPAKCID